MSLPPGARAPPARPSLAGVPVPQVVSRGAVQRILFGVSDTMLLDDLARQREAVPPARDRLMTTMFLVGALHALLILGVTFTPPRSAGSGDTPTLEVLLVHDPVAEQRINTAADYLAQVNQRGAGTDPDARRAESPHTPITDPASSAADSATDAQVSSTDGTGEADLLASRAQSRDRRFFSRGGPSAPTGTPLQVEPLSPETAGVDSGDVLRLMGHAERELMVAANTRESSVAVYLDAWRRKIERIGTANYPMDAARRAGLSGSPVLEVQILADGRLGGAVVQRSSGHAELDQAALAILKLAAPFEPFPKELAARHDALRLAYEWQFLGGELKDSTVRMPADTR
jgi:protein TonB